MTKEEILEELQAKLREMPVKHNRLFFDMEYDYFKSYFSVYANMYLKNKGYDHEYVANNESVLKQLYYWLVKDEQFKGDPVKGILLVGVKGIGKTFILGVFADVYNSLVKVRHGNKAFEIDKFSISVVESRSVDMFLGKHNSFPDSIISKPVIINDIAKESPIKLEYGNVIKPVSSFLYFRAEKNSLTFGTANYAVGEKNGENVFLDFYGESIEDRFYQMFNVIEMKGKSFRRK